ncbi:putative gustatory receptor 28b [Athalia rosae]|uniref:putative gustatory receptor 28b n=1 Tax=Athalia rosae TaxID=37344 RepID=UPI0020337E04|nr:putative gustatory receptor 28b [Athalia rosae]
MVEEINVVVKEPKTFKQQLKPIIYLSWLMGTGMCRPDDWRKLTTLIKLFHFTMCSVVVTYGIIDFFTIGTILKSEMFKIMYYTNKAVVYVTSYYYVFLGVFHYKKWKRFVERIDLLDKKIHREISMKNRSTIVHQIMALAVTALIGPLSLISHVVYYYFVDPSLIFASDVLLYYTIAQSLSTNFCFDVIVLAVYQRFKTVNRIIKQIGDSYTAPWIVLKIQRLKEVHYGICGLVGIVNNAHGIHLLLSSANSFMMVVATLFRIYIGVVESQFGFIMINNVIWIVYAMQFALNCYVCTITSREAARTGILIHEVGLKNNQLTNKRLYGGSIAGSRRSLSYQPETKTYEGTCIQNEIMQFSSQLQQNQVAFSACEFFVLNNSLFQGFIGVITTYLIILIQFYRPPENNEKLQTIPEIATLNVTEPQFSIGD